MIPKGFPFPSQQTHKALKEKKATLDHTNDTPILYSQYIIFNLINMIGKSLRVTRAQERNAS